MRRRQAPAPQRAPLRRARRREHLRAQMPGQLHRGHPDTARRRVHQQPLARAAARPGRPARSTPSGTTTGTDAACANDQPAGIRTSSRCVGHRHRAERRRPACPSPGRPARARSTPGPTSSTTPAPSLPSGRSLRRGTQSQRDQHVAEVQAGGAHRDTHLPRRQRLAHLGARDQAKILERAPSPIAKPPLRDPIRRHQRSAPGYMRKPRREHHPIAHGQLRPTSDRSPAASAAASACQEPCSSSMSTSTKRPGCSDCAERTRPHTGAAARAQRPLARAHRHRAPGDQHQSRGGQPLLREPRLHQPERAVRALVRELHDTLLLPLQRPIHEYRVRDRPAPLERLSRWPAPRTRPHRGRRPRRPHRGQRPRALRRPPPPNHRPRRRPCTAAQCPHRSRGPPQARPRAGRRGRPVSPSGPRAPADPPGPEPSPAAAATRAGLCAHPPAAHGRAGG